MAKQRVGDLAVFVSADGRQYFSEMSRIERHAGQFGGRVGGSFQAAGQEAGFGMGVGMGRGVAGAAAAAGSVLFVAGKGMADAVKDGMAENASRAKLFDSFNAFTRSRQEAGSLMRGVDKLADQGGFNHQAIGEGTRALVAQGLEGQKALGVMRDMGIIAAATGGDMNRMGNAVGQVFSKGKLEAEEFRQQLGENGFPTQLFAKAVSGSVEKLNAEMAAGKVTAERFGAGIRAVAEQLGGDEALAKHREGAEGRAAVKDQAWKRLGAAADAAFGWSDKMARADRQRTKLYDAGAAIFNGMGWLPGDHKPPAPPAGDGERGPMLRGANALYDGLMTAHRALREFGGKVTAMAGEYRLGLMKSVRDELVGNSFGPASAAPLDAFRHRVGQVNEADRYFGLGGAGKDRATLDAFGQLERNFSYLFETRLPQAMVRGSQAAEGVISRAAAAGQMPDRQKQVEMILGAANAQRQRIIELERDTLAALKKLDLKAVGVN